MAISNIAYIKGLGILQEVRLSASFCEKVNDQSCDCDSIILSGDQGTAYLTYHTFDEDSYIEINSVKSYNDLDYPFFVDLENRKFRFDEMCFYDDGSVEGIRFCADDTFLFVFASEYSLILTMSKYDLFESISMDFPEKEASLRMFCKKHE